MTLNWQKPRMWWFCYFVSQFCIFTCGSFKDYVGDHPESSYAQRGRVVSSQKGTLTIKLSIFSITRAYQGEEGGLKTVNLSIHYILSGWSLMQRNWTLHCEENWIKSARPHKDPGVLVLAHDGVCPPNFRNVRGLIPLKLIPFGGVWGEMLVKMLPWEEI